MVSQKDLDSFLTAVDKKIVEIDSIEIKVPFTRFSRNDHMRVYEKAFTTSIGEFRVYIATPLEFDRKELEVTIE